MSAPQTTIRWSHIALNCRDQAATEAFYQRLFGFRRARVVSLDHGEIVFLRQGEVYLELFSSAAPSRVRGAADGPPDPGIIRHLAFQTDDLDGFLEAAAGVPVSLGPLSFDDFIKGWRSVWLTDPDGLVVEVSEGYRDDDHLARHAAAHEHG
ncbi:VOC family protein [Actinoplanes sp. NEAU-A12]|uniref:VOC family protein n=1 Tax=Actinoplanes sandaracinus TaxID=3045177 RepID=A0ABT6WL61_9ACTN|nr:VOC family protein [Actinoplanes sandaracinus]MDI6100443.1 VOC family protein [Actinoplanes sandaracinus]